LKSAILKKSTISGDKKMQIKIIKAREVLDSRGNPTVEVDLTTEDGLFRSIVPSGASAGQHEAIELRDGDSNRFLGKGTLRAVNNVNNLIAPRVLGMDCTQQKEIDNLMIELDGTPNKKELGANAILPVSMSVTRAGAAAKRVPLYKYIGELYNVKANTLPVPMCNVINGGKHAGQENSMQEHMLVPTGARNFSEGIMMVSESYHVLAGLLKKKYGSGATLVGDEGGFAPAQIVDVRERLDFMLEAVKNAGHEGKIKIALDPASSEFFHDGIYKIGDKSFSGVELVDFYTELCKTYPIVSIEDGHGEDDWGSWVEMTKKLGNKIQVVGDDIFVTNTERIKKGISLKCANSVLIKLNQIGTVTETLNAMRMAHSNGWSAVVSHRSGETEDTFISDLVVGTNAGQIKTGAPARSDRNAKYNQLLRIEEELGAKSRYSWRD
jgi:enolase